MAFKMLAFSTLLRWYWVCEIFLWNLWTHSPINPFDCWMNPFARHQNPFTYYQNAQNKWFTKIRALTLRITIMIEVWAASWRLNVKILFFEKTNTIQCGVSWFIWTKFKSFPYCSAYCCWRRPDTPVTFSPKFILVFLSFLLLDIDEKRVAKII